MDPAHATTVRGSALGGRFILNGAPAAGSLPHLAEATHEAVAGRFILSLMPIAACSSTASVRALLEAARRATTLSHPGLVAVADAGDESEPPGLAFVAERASEGPTLAAFLGERGFLDLTQTAALISQMADALAAAHAAGLVHGELHPQAVLVEGGETAPIVRIRGVGWSEEITAARGSQEASPYRAPEHVGRLGGCDPKADQYGLAVIAYELLAGCLPFTGESADLADASALQDRVPPAIAELVPGVPDAVDAVVRRALSFDPDARFHDTRAFSEALSALALSAAVAAEREAATPLPDGQEAPSTAAESGPKAGAPNSAAGAGRGGKQKRKSKKKRAAAIHPSASEFQDDDGPTALENPATLLAAHRALEASFDASPAARQDVVQAPGMTPPKEPSATPPPHELGVTPPPRVGALGMATGTATPSPETPPPQTPPPATPPPHDLTATPPAALGNEAFTSTPPVSPAPAILPPPVVVPVASSRRSWPIIAGGGLILGGLVVWMLISLLRRPTHDENGPPAPHSALTPEGHGEGAHAKAAARGDTGPARAALQTEAVAAGQAEKDPAFLAPAAVATAASPCQLTVDSRPWSQVWLDDRDTGQRTPLVQYPIDCGTHTLAVRRPDLSLAQVERIDARAGRPVVRTILLQ